MQPSLFTPGNSELDDMAYRLCLGRSSEGTESTIFRFVRQQCLFVHADICFPRYLNLLFWKGTSFDHQSAKQSSSDNKLPLFSALRQANPQFYPIYHLETADRVHPLLTPLALHSSDPGCWRIELRRAKCRRLSGMKPTGERCHPQNLVLTSIKTSRHNYLMKQASFWFVVCPFLHIYFCECKILCLVRKTSLPAAVHSSTQEIRRAFLLFSPFSIRAMLLFGAGVFAPSVFLCSADHKSNWRP